MAWVLATNVGPEAARNGLLGSIVTLSEEVTGDNTKELDWRTSVGYGSVFRVHNIRMEYTATATVGNRLPEVRVLDAANDIVRVIGGALTVTASQVANIEFGNLSTAGFTYTGVGAIGVVPRPLCGDLMLGVGQKLAFLDAAAAPVDATDGMVMHVTGQVIG